MPDGDGYKAWYMGSHGTTGVDSIGYAESPDGIVWTKRPDPVLEPGTQPDTGEADLLNPGVVFDGTTYHMWYNGDYPNVATKIGYAYSGDGIEWTKHRGNPVHEVPNENIVTKSVLADGAAWRMWYSHFGVDPWRTSYATSDCCPASRPRRWRFIPAAAVASGAQGAFFQTDVDVSNADEQAGRVPVLWLPRGEDNSEPETSETFTLGAGHERPLRQRARRGLRPRTELATVPWSSGSSSPDLLAMSRTYNTPTGEPAGTYGQAMPAITSGDIDARTASGGGSCSAARMPICAPTSAARTAAPGSAVVNLELFAADGTSLGTQYMMLLPLGQRPAQPDLRGYARSPATSTCGRSCPPGPSTATARCWTTRPAIRPRYRRNRRRDWGAGGLSALNVARCTLNVERSRPPSRISFVGRQSRMAPWSLAGENTGEDASAPTSSGSGAVSGAEAGAGEGADMYASLVI